MKFSHFIALFCAVLMSVLSAAAMERVETRRVPLPDGGRVKISTGSGDIKVVPGDVERLELQLRCVSHEQKSQKARSVLNRVQLVMRRSDDTVSIDVLDRASGGTRLMSAKRLKMQFEVVVPQNCSLDVYTQEGSVQVGNLTGHMHVVTERGKIFLGQIDGHIYAATKRGDVSVSRSTGAAELKTDEGNVHIGTVSGHADLETKKGNIVVQAAYNTVSARTTQGDVIATLARVRGPNQLRSDMGNVRTTINPSENCFIAAKGRKVTSEIRLVLAQGGRDSGKHIGDYLGGGPRVEISAGGGKVQIVKGEPLFQERRR
ncbi:hypothetical protein AXK12_03375 [Cephaloticoccus capnophilus]|uniref:DUF4097 domain-containing protein n=1 Tax=Cephaloticoccus capnophilus TaxID=1548208 RepID=A0A139SPD2_9BACT|nr:DUF4097 family beta strand repeat-containing protein [Cephaloticoccus capnophilus]KXU36340.1 hypothetical protein AXK12_03375 [Cephaloticoccus capnophilus]